MSEDELWETDDEDMELGHPAGPGGRGGRESAIAVWDFTLAQDQAIFDESSEGWCLPEVLEPEMVIEALRTVSKHWGMQLELSSQTGYIHFQGRISLKVKQRRSTIHKHVFGNRWQSVNWSKTSTPNASGAAFYQYVTKLETCVDGPWTDKLCPIINIPARFQHNLRPWQQTIADSANTGDADTRSINVVVDHVGNIGKSYLTHWLQVRNIGRKLPIFNGIKEAMGWAYSFADAKVYIMDVPRAVGKDRMTEMMGMLEELKSGYVYETRYKGQERYLAVTPAIWVFTNKVPAFDQLSGDRWKFWRIVQQTLVPFIPPAQIRGLEDPIMEDDDMAENDLNLDPVFE